jgi:hypothetical protein
MSDFLIYMLDRLTLHTRRYWAKEPPAALCENRWRGPSGWLQTSITPGCRMRLRHGIKHRRRRGELGDGRQPGIADTIAPVARRSPLTLFDRSDAYHLRGDILAVVFDSRYRSR